MSRFDAQVLARAMAYLAAQASPPAPISPPAQPAPQAPASAPAAEPSSAVALAAGLCREFEGLYLRPYLCPAGVWTIGYGATRYEDGRAVGPADPPITRERAEALLMHDILTVRVPAVRRLCPGIDRPGRMAALVDFAFNAGVGALQMSTLRQRVNAGRWDAVPAELRRWVMAGGRTLPGLVRRREAEIRLL